VVLLIGTESAVDRLEVERKGCLLPGMRAGVVGMEVYLITREGSVY